MSKQLNHCTQKGPNCDLRDLKFLNTERSNIYTKILAVRTSSKKERSQLLIIYERTWMIEFSIYSKWFVPVSIKLRLDPKFNEFIRIISLINRWVFFLVFEMTKFWTLFNSLKTRNAKSNQRIIFCALFSIQQSKYNE